MLDKQVRMALQSTAVNHALALTALHALLAAWTLPAYVLSALAMIDNPWSIAVARATDAGHTLATEILRGCHGRRAVTLMGYGLGAVVCFTAAKDIAAAAATQLPPAHVASENGTLSAHQLLQDIILMGAPVSTSREDWLALRRVASGRVCNCFSSNDLVLRYTYRLREHKIACAGLGVIGGGEAEISADALAPALWNGIESFDVTDLVAGHLYWPSVVDVLCERMKIY
jgi:surfactin synthase thioesterase subunit